MNTTKIICPTCRVEAEVPRQFVDTQLQFHVEAGKDVRLFVLKCPTCMTFETEDVVIARSKADARVDEIMNLVAVGDWKSIVKIARELKLDIKVITQVDCALMLIQRPLDGMSLSGGKTFVAKLTEEEKAACPINFEKEEKEEKESNNEEEEMETEPTATTEPATETSADDFFNL